MESKHLDLKVPTGWQTCTTRELEIVAEEMIRSQMMASLSRFHPFDWIEIKTRLFFRFAQVKIVSQYVYDGDETDPRYGNTTFVCSHPSLGKKTFELQTWQVHSFLEQLAWLDAVDAKGRPVPMPKMLWPYPERLYWMEVYTNVSNALILEQEKRIKANPERIRELAMQQKNARLEVLARFFCVSDPSAPSKVKSASRRLLRKITEVEWQVIMFWWSSMMQYLKEQYPKCFRSSDKKQSSRSKSMPLPIELYTRSMATLQKYLGGLTEAEINAQTAHAILRHLNDMAVEAEEMEKIRRKHK